VLFPLCRIAESPTPAGVLYFGIVAEFVDADCELGSYIQKLKSLNDSFLRWIDQHVRSNPCCILSPVFRDYDRHVDDLNKTYGVAPERFSVTPQAAVASGSPFTSISTTVTNNAGKSLTVTSISGAYFSRVPSDMQTCFSCIII